MGGDLKTYGVLRPKNPPNQQKNIKNDEFLGFFHRFGQPSTWIFFLQKRIKESSLEDQTK